MKIRHCNTEKENRFDCNLCGKPTLSIKSKDPCQNCIKVYPHHKKCHSCGRIYPDQTCFECESSSCKYCIKRRLKAKFIKHPQRDNKKIVKPKKDFKLGNNSIRRFYFDQKNALAFTQT